MNAPQPTSAPAGRRGHRQRKTRSAAQLIVLGGLLVLVLVIAVSAAHSTRVALAARLLEADLRQLEAHPELRAEPDRMQQLELAATRLQQLAPQQIQTLELLARTHWLHAETAATPQLQIARLRQARAALQQALGRRSSWPYSWALLARIEFNLDPRGAAARIALEQALDLGMRGLRLQVQLLELRKLAEGRVDAALDERMRESFIGGLREHGSQLADHALQLGRIEWVCSDLEARTLLTSWCARFIAPTQTAPNRVEVMIKPDPPGDFSKPSRAGQGQGAARAGTAVYERVHEDSEHAATQSRINLRPGRRVAALVDLLRTCEQAARAAGFEKFPPDQTGNPH